MATEQGVMTRCERTGKLFQIVFQRQGPTWVAVRRLVPRVQPAQETLARPSLGRIAARTMAGPFDISSSYKGCPFCPAARFWRCNTCGQLNCWDGRLEARCAWCRLDVTIEGPIMELAGGPPPQSGQQRPRPVRPGGSAPALPPSTRPRLPHG